MNARTDHLPPHSLDAEQSVLGALLLDNGKIKSVAAILDPADFYFQTHREIYQHQTALADAGTPVDVTTLSDSLLRERKLDYVGGIAYLGALVENVPTAANVVHYAQIVADRSKRRQVAAIAETLRAAAVTMDGEPADELLAEAQEVLGVLQEGGKAAAAWSYPEAITADEMTHAKPSPACIVEDYLYADVGILAAPGSTGKTTMLLYEAVHIVLGRPLYGLRVYRPGAVVILTAEDSRDICVARLHSICEALQLSEAEVAAVLRDVRISDVRGMGFKLTRVKDDVVVPAGVVNRIIAGCKGRNIAAIVIDPAVSFGVGESRVNDAEQGLIDAARKLNRALDCCVRYVHHTGQSAAREKTIDQYAGRGGSAFADGCRMVAVMQPLTADEWRTATGASLLDGESGILLARPKVSYAPPNQPHILISRRGYAFAHSSRLPTDPMTVLAADCEQIVTLIESELTKGRRPTKNYLEGLGEQINLSRKRIRAALATLQACNRIEEARIEPPPKSGLRSYLRPINGSPIATGDPTRKAP